MCACVCASLCVCVRVCVRECECCEFIHTYSSTHTLTHTHRRIHQTTHTHTHPHTRAHPPTPHLYLQGKERVDLDPQGCLTSGSSATWLTTRTTATRSKTTFCPNTERETETDTHTPTPTYLLTHPPTPHLRLQGKEKVELDSQGLAMGTLMLDKRKKRDMVDNAYNRHA